METFGMFWAASNGIVLLSLSSGLEQELRRFIANTAPLLIAHSSPSALFAIPDLVEIFVGCRYEFNIGIFRDSFSSCSTTL